MGQRHRYMVSGVLVHHLEHLPPSTREPWDLFMKDMYKHTPYLKNFFKNNEQWYSPDFNRYLKN